MLADQLDYIIGVDPHRDSHALAVVQVVSGVVMFESAIGANSDGYARALQLADEHARGRRAFAVEGTGSLTVPGIGWVLAYTIAAEIGDIERFASPRKLTGYSGSALASTSQA